MQKIVDKNIAKRFPLLTLNCHSCYVSTIYFKNSWNECKLCCPKGVLEFMKFNFSNKLQFPLILQFRLILQFFLKYQKIDKCSWDIYVLSHTETYFYIFS